ncbi:hypothetical protein Zmor_015869 [Zophobas morio]|uniref:Uncharacterized protein n=1 Tax=Zophobas morio TaxID=2755281 RepID=A0AA38IKX7_9CUCU|nr:hypothetical protein Zmor_015869 [Zophobas morio]
MVIRAKALSKRVNIFHFFPSPVPVPSIKSAPRPIKIAPIDSRKINAGKVFASLHIPRNSAHSSIVRCRYETKSPPPGPRPPPPLAPSTTRQRDIPQVPMNGPSPIDVSSIYFIFILAALSAEEVTRGVISHADTWRMRRLPRIHDRRRRRREISQHFELFSADCDAHF